MEMHEFKTGIYQHYKGNKYLALGLARHEETLEWLVIYIPLYDNEKAKIWARPFAKFVENVEVDGDSVPRFRFVSSV